MAAKAGRYRTVIGAVALAVVLSIHVALAQAVAFLGTTSIAHHLVATGPQPLSPGVWVELNPCPLPPGGFGSTSNLLIPVEPFFTARNFSSNLFELDFGATDKFGAVNFPAFTRGGDETFPIAPPNADGFFGFSGFDGEGHTFSVNGHLALSGAGGGPIDPAGWVALNPCPLPPGFPSGTQLPNGLIQFQFDPPDGTTATFSFTLSIDGGNPVSFREVGTPEPATAILGSLALALTGVYALRRRAKRA